MSIDEYLRIMEKAVESSLAGFSVYDKNGKFVYCNRMLEILTGHPREIMERSTSEELRERERNGLSATLMVLESGEEVLLEQNMVHNGKRYLTKGIPFLDAEGKIAYVISNIVDVSRLQELQKRIGMGGASRAGGAGETVSRPGAEAIDPDKAYLKDKLLIYGSESMRRVMEQVRMLRHSTATVLLQGESGTGKEVIARVLHDISDRKDGAYVRINCGAIPESLFESELFGYAPGSFTGGDAKGRVGLLEQANHGTVLLDEIGEIPLNLQSKILRVLQEGEVQKIGKTEPIPVDIRVIAATNIDLLDRVREGKFRKDLYYRLNVIPITLPPLRERQEDIPELVYHFLFRLNRKYGLDKTIGDDVVARIRRMDFPGNIRELENLMERLLFLSRDPRISVEDLDAVRVQGMKDAGAGAVGIEAGMSLAGIMERCERQVLLRYLREFGTTRRIAEALKVNQSTISRKLKKYGILPEK